MPLTLLLFTVLTPRRAILASIIGGWLFLPVAGFEIRGLPNYTKLTAVVVGCLMGAMLFDLRSFLKLTPSLLDFPIIVLCLAPLGTSVTNDLGVYDGLSGVLEQIITWGIPYVLGRVYFADLIGVRELAIGVLAAGVIYGPLCAFEIRMSPQLHNWVYGFHQHEFAQTIRGGGWRPTVFLQHGLAVGMLMSTASLAGVWLWWTGGLRQLWGFPMSLVLPCLLATTILCKSLGSILWLVGGLGALATARITRLNLPLLCMAAIPIVYVSVRAPGIWSGEPVLSLVKEYAPERGASLETRINAENLLAAKALEQPLWGWGGFGRNRVYNEDGVDIAVTDGLWILEFGVHGGLSLAALIAALVLPAIRGVMLVPPGTSGVAGAAPAVLSVVLMMYALDNLMNAMINPAFHLAMGALAGLTVAPVAVARRPAPAVAPARPIPAGAAP